MGDASAYRALAAAMEESLALMDREYYSMRLKIDACGYDVGDYPEALFFCLGCAVKATPHNSARADFEKKQVLMMAVFCRNTLCISRKSDEIRACFFRKTPIMIIGWRNQSRLRLISLPNDRFGSE